MAQKATTKALLGVTICPPKFIVLVGVVITACGWQRDRHSLKRDRGSLAHYLTILKGEGLRNNLISRASAQVMAL